MKRILPFTLLLLACLCLPSKAQSLGVLEKVIAELDTSKGIQIEFQMQGELSETPIEGNYYALGHRFYLTSPIMQSWYNGTDLWVYVHQNEEVNLSRPTPEELTDVNPLTNLQLIQKRKMTLHESKTDQGYQIIALPNTPEKAYLERIIVQTNTKYTPTLLQVYDKNSSQPLTIHIKSIHKGVKLDNALFTFTANKAPKIAVIDLR